MSIQPLPPNAPLPSGWSIEPVTGCCTRISDGIRFGLETSHAIAWATTDIQAQQPGAAGAALDLARLRRAVGCAAVGNVFTGDRKEDCKAAGTVHAIGAALACDAQGAWHWQPERVVEGGFNQRLGAFLDQVGVQRARRPAARPHPGEAELLAGAIGCLAVRSELVTGADGETRVALLAEPCPKVADAMARAHAWAMAAVWDQLAESAQVALAFLRQIAYHEHAADCVELTRRLEQLLAARPAPAQPERGA